MMSTVLEMSPISLTVHILSAQIAQLVGEKRLELFVEVQMIVFLNDIVIINAKYWLKGIDGRCTEDLKNETISLDGSKFTNLTAGRYC